MAISPQAGRKTPASHFVIFAPARFARKRWCSGVDMRAEKPRCWFQRPTPGTHMQHGAYAPVAGTIAGIGILMICVIVLAVLALVVVKALRFSLKSIEFIALIRRRIPRLRRAE
jgi:hypothetical protein